MTQADPGQLPGRETISLADATGKRTHRFPVRVYYEDTDAGGVVYHARYLGMAERARTEALRDLGVPHAEMERDHGVIFMVRRVSLEYLRPARLDSLLEVVTEPLTLGGASVVLRQSFLSGGQTLAVAEVVLVCVRLADGRPARIPERWRAALGASEWRTGGAGTESPEPDQSGPGWPGTEE
jgi:acyl-CoA thioester hydrolase